MKFPHLSALSGNGMKWDMEARGVNDPEDVVLVATNNPTQVYKLEKISTEGYITELLQESKFDVAKEVLSRSLKGMSVEKKSLALRKLDTQIGSTLITQLEFKRGVEYCTELDPREYLAFFPQYHIASFAYEPIVLTPHGSQLYHDIENVIDNGKKNNYRKNIPNKELEVEACTALITFLQHHLKSENTVPDSRTHAAIVHALFHLYIDFNARKEIQELLLDSTHQNALDLAQAEPLLTQHSLYGALAIVYEIQKKNLKALNIYERIGTGDLEEVSCDALEKSILLLLKTSDETLLYKYSTWILKRSSSRGLELLSSFKPSLDSDTVIKHLKRINPSLAQRYLEGVVSDTSKREEITSSSSLKKREKQNIQGNSHHTKLALEYLQDVIECIKGGGTISVQSPGSEVGALGKARKRLIRFLKSSSSCYDPIVLLPKVKSSILREEFFILCGKSHRHGDALLLLSKEKDSSAAEKYCVSYGTLGNNNNDDDPIHMIYNPALLLLFQMLLKESSNSGIEKALSLLSRHAKALDALEVLVALPDDMNFSSLEPFLTQALPHSAHVVRETMLCRNLSNVYNLQMQSTRAVARGEATKVGTDTVCQVCRKRIGDIVFATYPNGTIAHYSCTNGHLESCPVTGEKFG